jgi:phage shock protein E
MKKFVMNICLSILCFLAFGCASQSSSPLGAKSDQISSINEKIRAGALLVDVRSPEEFNQGHLSGALNIPIDHLDDHLDAFGDDLDREIVVYCRSGRRAGIAVGTLEASGYDNVTNAGGYAELAKVISSE